MAQAVEDFAYKMITDVFNAQGTASLAIDALLKAGSHYVGAKGSRIEEPAEWTDTKIAEKAKLITSDKGPEGNFED